MPYIPALQNLCVVMVATSHPGNIGSAARAMKTMGVGDLRLVAPHKPYSQETWALASGANDIVEQARIVPTLVEAVADCQVVIGSSARVERSVPWPQMDARTCGGWVAQQLGQGAKVALVFGRERSGLTNEELDHCNVLVHIPMAFDFLSLNLAMAVQVLCYECMMAVQGNQAVTTGGVAEDDLADHTAMEAFYAHLQETLVASRFLDPENPRLLMRRLRRLFGRVGLTASEVGMLRGILAAYTGRKFQKRGVLTGEGS